MTVADVCEKIGGRLVSGSGERTVEGLYIGDLLSHVMGKLPENFAWFTVMNNVNVAAVAGLTDCACVVLCDGTVPDSLLLEKAGSQGINIVVTPLDLYSASRSAS